MRTSTSLTLILAGLLAGCATTPCTFSDDAEGASVACSSGSVSVARLPGSGPIGLGGPDLARPPGKLPGEPRAPGDGEPPALPTDDERLGAGPGEPGPVVMWAEPADDSQCPNGGTAVTTFVDNDHDGRPSPDETATTTLLCDGEAEKMVLVETHPIPVGLQCVTGGLLLVTGVDSNFDGVLMDSEITDRVAACNPQPLSAEIIPGYRVVPNTRSEFSVRVAIDETVPFGTPLNWGVKLNEKGSGKPIAGVQLAYDTTLGRGDMPIYSMPVVTNEFGNASFGPEVGFRLDPSNFGGQNGAVVYLRIVTAMPGAYDVTLDLLPASHGPVVGREIFPLQVANR